MKEGFSLFTLRSFLVLLFLFAYLVLLIPLHLVLRFIGIFNGDMRQKAANTLVYWAFKWELFQSGARIEVIGQENIPEGAVLFVPNHRSYFDILLLHTTCTKRPGFVAKAEMDHYIGLNWWMRDIRCLFLDRDDIKSGFQMIKDGTELLKAGHSMVIFAEGTRNHKKEMLPFKEGSIKMAERAGCPVVPVTLMNTDQLLEVRPGFSIKKADVKVIYGEPIYIQDLSREEKKKAGAYVQGIIADTIEKYGGQIGRPEVEEKEDAG